MNIPILIDSVKKFDDFQMTRCIYFRIESLDPPVFSNSFIEAVQDIKTGIVRWFDWGVICRPSDPDSTGEVFDSIESINKTFEYLEDKYFVDFAHIWVPNRFFPKRPSSETIKEKTINAKRGDVYRIPLDVFSCCHNFITGNINQKEWFKSFKEVEAPVVYCQKETTAFQNWRKKQIQEERDRYHSEEYMEFRLPKRTHNK